MEWHHRCVAQIHSTITKTKTTRIMTTIAETGAGGAVTVTTEIAETGMTGEEIEETEKEATVGDEEEEGGVIFHPE